MKRRGILLAISLLGIMGVTACGGNPVDQKEGSGTGDNTGQNTDTGDNKEGENEGENQPGENPGGKTETETKEITALEIESDKTELETGETAKITVKATPSDADVSKVTLKAKSGGTYVTIKGMDVTFKKGGGSAVIYAQFVNSKKEKVNSNEITITTKKAEVTVQEYDVTLDLNYEGKPENTVYKVKRNRTFSTIAESYEALPRPEREGYFFTGWFESKTETDFTKSFNFNSAALGPKTLYAGWVEKSALSEKEYIFDAENSYSLLTMSGPGYSGSNAGMGMVASDSSVGAHNDKFVSYLYQNNSDLKFVIYASEAATNVTLKASLSIEFFPAVSLTNDNYKFKVNGVDTTYSEIKMSFPDPTAVNNTPLTFQDFTISTSISLNAGKNEIDLVTANSELQGKESLGTMGATAPLVDCIKLTTTAGLTWTPIA